MNLNVSIPKLMNNHPRSSEVIAYTAVAGLGAILDFFISIALVKSVGLDPKLALLITMIFSGTLCYFLHGVLTFRSQSFKPSKARAAIFLGTTAFVYAIRAITLHVLAQTDFFNMELALASAIVIGSAINFLISKYFVYARKAS